MNRIIKAIINRDIQLFYLINRKIKCRLLDLIMPRITHLGGAIFTFTVTFLLVFFGGAQFRQVGWEAMIALVSSGIFVQLAKYTFNRSRPYEALEKVNLTTPPFDVRSFPSGHTTAIFSVAMVLGFNFPSFYPVSQTIAGLVAVSRAYVGVHYPSDIITGALIGIYFSNWAHGLF
ncbi:phosphatase PAP2 family protein [Orenia marismortui]|uniref:Undecaprenyl-diphosphatase n=1 Tax=Orenia marismortui TaxID=46469 RepID=A0A4R8GRE0_9FIRM|nr:phosphatase PAP2 family protein [Orenia marismortui]TDX48432.1 undecaprenyl-diphosphatase [Orenia marismortui]